MSKEKKESSYILDSDEEPIRLEIQADLDNVEAHLARLPLTNDAFVLDAGCGSGSMVRVMAKEILNGHVFGIDSNLTHLSYAQRIIDKKEFKNITFICGDVYHLPFPENKFDLLWSK